LSLKDFAAADSGKAKEAQQAFLVITFALGRNLGLHDRSVCREDEIAVASGLTVLVIIEVENGGPLVNPAAHRCDLSLNGIGRNCFIVEQLIDRNSESDPTTGNRCSARSTVRLDHIAVDDDLTFAELRQFDDGPQASADQPLNLLRPTRLLALGGFSIAARVGSSRKHSIFGGNPALALAAKEGRHPVLDRGGAQHAGFAKGDKA